MSKKEMSEPDFSDKTSQDAYWIFEDEISRGMNRLKGQIFNLIEASVVDKNQQDALKGLIRGFANDSYHQICDNMRYIARDFKIIPESVGQTLGTLD